MYKHFPALSKDSTPSPTKIHMPRWIATGRPSLSGMVPHRLRRKIRSTLRNRQSPASSFADLQTSFSPSDTLRSLRSHQWSFFDGQYLIVTVLLIFALAIITEPAVTYHTAILVTLLLTSLVFPITRQFFLPFLPIATWLIFFFACR